MGLGAVLLAVGVAAAQAPAPADYHVGPRDVLHVDVYAKADLSGEYAVTSDGEISFPFCGLVRVADLTVIEAEQAIRTCLLDGVLVDPQLSIRVHEFRSQRVEVRGAVAKPGAYFLDGPTTLRQMLGRAGDVEIEQSTGVVAVLRGEERITITFSDINGAQGEMLLTADDVVLVDEGAVVLVGGQVAKPGPVAYTEGLTVTEALVRAGDATGVANLAASYVLRDGEKIEVNLRRIRKGRAADLLLQPGDQVVVPESPF